MIRLESLLVESFDLVYILGIWILANIRYRMSNIRYRIIAILLYDIVCFDIRYRMLRYRMSKHTISYYDHDVVKSNIRYRII